MKKRKCISCGGRKFSLFEKKIDYRIYRCLKCDLGIYEGKRATSTEFIPKLSRGAKELLTIVKSQVREGKILEISRDLLGKELVKQMHFGRQGKRDKVIKMSYIEFIRKTKERFDLITFVNVLESYRRPDVVLLESKKILLDRGLFFIVVPNRNSLFSGHVTKDAQFSFSRRSLINLLKKSHLKLNYMKTAETYADFSREANHDIQFYLIKTPLYFLLRRLAWFVGMGGYVCLVVEKSTGYN